MQDKGYIDATQEAGKDFYIRLVNSGSITMLNMLKFKDVADYSNLLEIAPEGEITGEEAYKLYIKETLPFLEEAGSEVIYYGKGGKFLVGPEAENWDVVLLVKHKSVADFMAFAQNEAYLKVAGHRTAALADSRLLPMVDTNAELD